MTTMLMDAEIYVEDMDRYRALAVDGDEVLARILLDREQSLEVADRLEALSEGCGEPLELDDGPDHLGLEAADWMKVRIDLNGVRGVVDRHGVREIAHDLRARWEEERCSTSCASGR